MALSKIDTTNMIEDVPQSKLDNNINFRNIIINGGMDLAQRGTSQASAGNASGNYQTIDRFAFANQNMGVFTISQDTDVPSAQGFAKSLKLDCTTADASPATNDYLILQQPLEGQNLQYLKKGTSSAESLTLSFWVKSNKTGTYIAQLRDNDNSRNISKSYTINSTNTWEKKTITYVGDTTGIFDNDNNSSLALQFWLGAGTNFTSGTLATSWESITNANRAVGQVNLADSTSNEWYITGVQLEAGQTASEFEFLPFDVNMQRCSRYYTVLKIGATGYATGSGQSASVRESFNFMSPMRSAPSFTTSGLGGVGINTTSIANDITENGGYVSPFSTATGRIYFAGTFAFDSEL